MTTLNTTSAHGRMPVNHGTLASGQRLKALFPLVTLAIAIAFAFALSCDGQCAYADEFEEQAATAPAKASVKKLESTAPGKLTVKVKKVADAAGYQYKIARDARFSKGVKTKKAKGRSATFKKLAKGKTYYVKVRAYKLVDGTKIWGKWSAKKKIRVKKSSSTQDGAVTTITLDITLAQMASWQLPYANGESLETVLRLLNPANVTADSAAYYQFANLKGSSGLTAEQIDSFIASTASGRSGKLKGLGKAFVDASAQYGVNECYLLAQAIWESGWGTSDLAKGFEYQGSTYYNFFGIGAYDGNALSGGRGAAVKYGWTSRRKAILGAAEFIANYYFNRETYPQDTLYGMKWDYLYSNAAMARGYHQYASDPYWPTQISVLMAECYAYCQYSPQLTYIVPQYKS